MSSLRNEYMFLYPFNVTWFMYGYNLASESLLPRLWDVHYDQFNNTH